MQGKQLEEARETALEESKERLLEEVQAREVSLTEALAESHAGLASMKRLHEASQRQLFAMQSRTEEEQVWHAETQSQCHKAQHSLAAYHRQILDLCFRLSGRAEAAGKAVARES